MSKKLTPIAEAIAWCDEQIKHNQPPYTGFCKGFKAYLQSLLTKEKEFAETTFLAGQFHGEEISQPDYKATYETENPDFDDFYKQYNNE